MRAVGHVGPAHDAVSANSECAVMSIADLRIRELRPSFAAEVRDGQAEYDNSCEANARRFRDHSGWGGQARNSMRARREGAGRRRGTVSAGHAMGDGWKEVLHGTADQQSERSAVEREVSEIRQALREHTGHVPRAVCGCRKSGPTTSEGARPECAQGNGPSELELVLFLPRERNLRSGDDTTI